ncbi:MAG: phosphatidylserine decarboxylase, partial [Leptospiraceae bacterium]|nr:phosphatidylserine decarboxylase [Leptospiraceae bacterium]
MEKGYLIPLGKEIFNPYFIILCLVGLYLTVKLRFPQFRFFFLAFKIFSGALDFKGLKGQLIHSQAFFAGTGSSLLIGAAIGSAFAFLIGGPGALLWIWLATIIMMPMRLVTSTLAIKFRTKLPNGRYLSGPMYFIEKALKARWLAIAFALTSLVTVLTLGGIVPILSMEYIANKTLGLRGMDLPLLFSAFLIYAVLGGIRRVGKISGTLIPIALILFFISYYFSFSKYLIPFSSFIKEVFKHALELKPVITGGSLALFTVVGESMGTFFISTETGVGKSAGISGVVRTDSPVKQGLVSMLSSAFEGFVTSTLIFYLLVSVDASSLSRQKEFLDIVLSTGGLPVVFLTLSFLIFGFVGICGWFYTGEQNAYYVLGEKFANFFRIVFIGSFITASYLYMKFGMDVLINSFQFAYTMAIISAIPVTITLVLLAKIVSYEMNKYLSESGAEYEVLKDFYILILSMLPKNLLSKVFGFFTYLQLPRFMMIPLLKAFAGMYKINLDEAELQLSEYKSLNLFFTRALKAGVRIINSEENAAVSPVDAKITNYGDIHENTMIQAKGIDFNLKELLGSEKFYPCFESGKFITFYLSPQDYHRIHSPAYGKILGYYYEPGKLFPVNELAVKGIRGLFPKNERLITFLQTEYGKIAVIKVGASNVGKIRVTYDKKIVTNTFIRIPREVEYKD